jgi:hypothetical protein
MRKPLGTDASGTAINGGAPVRIAVIRNTNGRHWKKELDTFPMPEYKPNQF